MSGGTASRGARGWVGPVPLCLSLAAFLVASPDGRALGEELPDVSARPPWIVTERIDDPEGYVLYQLETSGSDFAAFRLEATIAAPPDRVADAFRKNAIDPNASPRNMKKTVLHAGDDGLLVYVYIDMPLVSDRDVTTRGVRSFDPTTGSHRFEWAAVDEGPPPIDGVVRLQKSSGSWVFTPISGGRTYAVYENHTEIAGAIPAWLLNGFMSDAVVEGLARLKARVERDGTQLAAESEEDSTSSR